MSRLFTIAACLVAAVSGFAPVARSLQPARMPMQSRASAVSMDIERTVRGQPRASSLARHRPHLFFLADARSRFGRFGSTS